MTEPKKGEPVTTPPEENVKTPAPQEYAFPEGHKFHGKTSKEVAEAYEGLEKTMGQSAKDFDAQKTELDGYKSWYTAAQQAAATQKQEPTQTPKEDLYAEERGIAKEETQKAVNQMRFESALKMAPLAMNEAKRIAPHLFEGGSEKEIQDMFMGTIMRGGMNPDFATDPNNWVMAAYNYHGQKTGYKSPATPQTMIPGQTEVPSATKPPLTDEPAEVPWSATAQSMWEKVGSEAFGGKKEDLTKAVQDGIAEGERLAK